MSSDDLQPVQTADSRLPDVFHRVNRIIPDAQILISVEPETTVREALRLMATGSFSQLPVALNRCLLGMFSHRTLVTYLQSSDRPTVVGDLTVGECMQADPHIARISDDVSRLFNELDRSDAVLVGEPDNLQAILTPMDVLRYLYKVASPFVLLSEIELALRSLVRSCADDATIQKCADKSLAYRYQADKVPRVLEEMTFADYMDLICYGENWPIFQPVIGGSRERARAKLDDMRELRNVVFHLRRDVSVDEYQRLVGHRDWMYAKVREASLRGVGR